MSHSDSEIKDHFKEKIRKQLQIEFKAKKKITTAQDVRFLKRRLQLLADHQDTRLLQAVNFHNTDEVRRLLGFTSLGLGASANSTDNELRSALHIAVSKGYGDIVELLLKHGADPNKRDAIQNTPLHLAACIHNLPIISMLIKAGADVSCLDIHGRNPYQLALSKLQILQRVWREGAIEMVKLREELQQVVDLLLSLLMRGVEDKMRNLNRTSVNDLQLMKLSLNSGPAEQLDDQMTKLMSDIEQIKI